MNINTSVNELQYSAKVDTQQNEKKAKSIVAVSENGDGDASAKSQGSKVDTAERLRNLQSEDTKEAQEKKGIAEKTLEQLYKRLEIINKEIAKVSKEIEKSPDIQMMAALLGRLGQLTQEALEILQQIAKLSEIETLEEVTSGASL